MKISARLFVTTKPGSNKGKLLFSSYRAAQRISSGISEWQEKSNLTPLILYHYFKAQKTSGPMVNVAATAYLRPLLSLRHPPRSVPTPTAASALAAPAPQDRIIPAVCPRDVNAEFPSLTPALTFMGFSSYVGVPRSISASCSRLASSPGLSQVGGSHWVCLQEDRQTDQPPSLLKVTCTCLLIVPSTGTSGLPSVTETLNMGVMHGPTLLLMTSFE